MGLNTLTSALTETSILYSDGDMDRNRDGRGGDSSKLLKTFILWGYNDEI